MKHGRAGAAEGVGTPLRVRLGLLAVLAGTLGIMAARVFSYRPLLLLPGARMLWLEAAGLLAVYGVVVAWPPRTTPLPRRPMRATMLGFGAAGLQIAELLAERFTTISRPWNGALTLGCMLATFAIWGVAGFRASRRGGTAFAGCGDAVWCAVVTMTIVVAAGTLLELFVAPIPAAGMATWVEFQRTGWGDLRAFSIANTLDEASTHLLLGPVAAVLFGGAGWGWRGLDARGVVPAHAPRGRVLALAGGWGRLLPNRENDLPRVTNIVCLGRRHEATQAPSEPCRALTQSCPRETTCPCPLRP